MNLSYNESRFKFGGVFSLITIFVISVLIGLDQYTKYLATALLDLPGQSYPFWPDVFHFTYVENRGMAFGMMQGYIPIFAIVSIILFLGIIWAFYKLRPMPLMMRISLSLVAAGGVGNFIDRMRLGYVVDFLEVRLFNFWVFNLADTCLTVGVIIFCIYYFFFHEKYFPPKTKPDTEDVEA